MRLLADKNHYSYLEFMELACIKPYIDMLTYFGCPVRLNGAISETGVLMCIWFEKQVWPEQDVWINSIAYRLKDLDRLDVTTTCAQIADRLNRLHANIITGYNNGKSN